MASIVLGAAGSYLGGPIGGMIGSAIGGMLDSMLFGTRRKGPKISDLDVTSSTFGQPIPQVFGAVRVAGNIIQSSDLSEVKHNIGGKGGPQVTEYIYYATFAVGVCKGPINAIWRIWADGRVIYDKRPWYAQAADTPNFASTTVSGTTYPATEDVVITANTEAYTVNLYTGTETQMPDSELETVSGGAGNQPAYRGLAYAVFPNFKVSDFGNRVPNMQFEVYGGGNLTLSGAWENEFQSLDTGWSSSATELEAFSSDVMANGNSVFSDGTNVVCAQPNGILAWTETITNIVGDINALVTSPVITGSTAVFSAAPIQSGQWLFYSFTEFVVSGPRTGVWLWAVTANPYVLNAGGRPTIKGAMCAQLPGSTSAPYLNPAGPFMMTGAKKGTDKILSIASSFGASYGVLVMPAPDTIANATIGATYTYTFFSFESGYAANFTSGILGQCTGFTVGYLESDGSTYATRMVFFISKSQITNSTNTGIMALAAGRPNGLMLGIDFGTNLNTETGLQTAPDFVDISASFTDQDGNGTVPFLYGDEGDVAEGLSYLSTAQPGGTDDYFSLPGICLPQSDGSTVVGFFMPGTADSIANLSNAFKLGAVRLFVHSPGTGSGNDGFIMTSIGALIGQLYTSAQIGAGVSQQIGPEEASFIWLSNGCSNATSMSGQSYVIGYIKAQTDGDPGIVYYTQVGQFQPIGGATLSSIVESICESCGLLSTDIDASTLSSTTVNGYTVSKEMTGRAAIEPLQQVFFFDGVESDWKIKFTFRNKAASSTIVDADLGARADNATKSEIKLQKTRTGVLDLPRGIIVRFPLSWIDYQMATQHVKRSQAAINPQNLLTIEVPIVMIPVQAVYAAEVALYFAWASRTQYTLAVPRNRIAIDPGDVVNISYTDDEGNAQSETVYITSADFGANDVINLVGHYTDPTIYVGGIPASNPFPCGNPNSTVTVNSL